MEPAMPRKALLVLALVVLGALLVLALAEPPGSGDGGAETDGGGPSGPEVEQAAEAAGDSGAETTTGGGRTSLVPGSGTSGGGIDAELGIPSFVGRVLRPDGSPAAEARIEAWGMSGWAVLVDPGSEQNPPLESWLATCDGDGRFALPEPRRDGLRFLIRATAEGLPPVELANQPAMPGRTRDLGELLLREGFAVRGTVSGPDGEPVAAARVVPVPELDTAAFPNVQLRSLPALPGYEATTDAGGAFELRDLPPGRFRLRAAGPGYVEGMSAPLKGDSGGTVEGLELALDRAGSVRGIVLGPGRQGVGSARLLLEADGNRLEAVSGAGGDFVIEAPEGLDRARLRAAADGYFPTQRDLRGDALRLPVEVELSRMPPITGWVQDAAGRSVAGAAVKLVVLSRGRSSGQDPERLEGVAEATTAEDGTFTLSPAISRSWERRFRVVAWSDQHAAGWSNPLVLDENRAEPPAPVEVVLAPGQAVTGAVLGPAGEAAAGARVHLRRLQATRMGGRNPLGADTRRRSSILRTATADAAGRFAFTGVPLGDYRLEAYLPGHSPAEGEEFPLLEGRPVEQLLQLLPPSGIEGTVVGDLRRLGPLRVTATRDGIDPLDTTVDGAGRFVLTDIPPGDYAVEVREVDPALGALTFLFGSGDPLARADGVEVAPGGTGLVTLELELEDRAALRGEVLVNGQPRAGMGVYLVPQDLGGMNDPRTGWRAVSRRMRSTTTDFEGRYELAALDADDYWVVVEQPGRQPGGIFRFGGGRESEAGPTGAARAELRLGPGQEKVQDFRIALGAVSGVARVPGQGDSWRNAPRGTRGVLRPVGLAGIAELQFQVGRGGRFRLEGVPTGDWTVDLSSRDALLRDRPVMVPYDDEVELDLRMEARPPRPAEDGGR
jgi:hypothetical protein